MKTYEFNEIIKENTVIALGYFDAIHIGHKALLKRAVELSKKYKKISAIVTTVCPRAATSSASQTVQVCTVVQAAASPRVWPKDGAKIMLHTVQTCAVVQVASALGLCRYTLSA